MPFPTDPREPAINVNNRNWSQLHKLANDETLAAARVIVEAKPKIESLTPNELYVVIKSLPLKKKGMEREMGFGVKYLHMLLDREGVSHVVNFSKEISRIVSEEEKLFPYDFDDKSAAAL